MPAAPHAIIGATVAATMVFGAIWVATPQSEMAYQMRASSVEGSLQNRGGYRVSALVPEGPVRRRNRRYASPEVVPPPTDSTRSELADNADQELPQLSEGADKAPANAPLPAAHRLSNLPELDHIAVVMIGGGNRSDGAIAADATWLSMFRNRLYVTDRDPNASMIGSSLAANTVNVFAGYATEDEQIDRYIHPKHPFLKHRGHQRPQNTHTTGWHLAQPRFLLGLQELVRRYPSASWYFIADSDTFVFPRRLSRGLLSTYAPHEQAVALGTLWSQRRGGPEKVSALLGGSGTAISAAAIAQMNLTECVLRQDADIYWNRLASDWRISECLRMNEASPVSIENADFMFMFNTNFNCAPLGPANCAPFYGRVHKRRTDCPYTYHYMDAEAVRNEFEKNILNSGKVCIPQRKAQKKHVFPCACEDS